MFQREVISSSFVKLSQTAIPQSAGMHREWESVLVCAEGYPGRPGVHQPVKCAWFYQRRLCDKEMPLLLCPTTFSSSENGSSEWPAVELYMPLCPGAWWLACNLLTQGWWVILWMTWLQGDCTCPSLKLKSISLMRTGLLQMKLFPQNKHEVFASYGVTQ